MTQTTLEYNNELYSKLTDICYKIINKENLPVPEKIIFRNSFRGTKTTNGTCYLNKLYNKYHIIVHLNAVNLIEDVNGIYKHKKTGKLYKRLPFGKRKRFKDILKTTAHEIAHLKYFDHSDNHKIFTELILRRLVNELKNKNIQFGGNKQNENVL